MLEIPGFRETYCSGLFTYADIRCLRGSLNGMDELGSRFRCLYEIEDSTLNKEERIRRMENTQAEYEQPIKERKSTRENESSKNKRGIIAIRPMQNKNKMPKMKAS